MIYQVDNTLYFVLTWSLEKVKRNIQTGKNNFRVSFQHHVSKALINELSPFIIIPHLNIKTNIYFGKEANAIYQSQGHRATFFVPTMCKILTRESVRGRMLDMGIIHYTISSRLLSAKKQYIKS